MKYIVKLAILSLAAIYGMSCQEKDVMLYNASENSMAAFPGSSSADRALYTGYDESKKQYNQVFSFATLPSGTEETTVDLPVKVIGLVASYDRKVGIEIIADETSATTPQDYEILESVIPAGEIYGRIRFLLKNKASLADKADTIAIKIVDSEDLKGAPQEYRKGMLVFNNALPGIPSATFNYGTYNLFILSEQSKTANNLVAYSPNAHKAILEAMGWPVGFWGKWNQSFDPFNMMSFTDGLYTSDTFQQRLKTYLDNYAEENGERLKHNAGSQKGKDVVARVNGAVYVP